MTGEGCGPQPGAVGLGAKAAAVGLGAALVAWSTTAGLQIPGRRHPLIQAGLGTALALSVRAPLGLRGPALRAGVHWGVLGAAAVTAGVAATTAVPLVRTGMAARDLPTPQWKWLAVEIPLGTVWSEETAYRAALGTLAESAFGPRVGRLLQATAFGLSHIVDARGAGEPVLGTVLVTGVAGWAFGWLAHRSGSIVAPALTHLAVNEAGAVAAGWVQRRAA
ncbi:CPBP family intramembrane glutamic endopeptidase [Mycobacterium sp. ACS4331]|uniref:Rv0804 family intramembrane glutamic endopeptidase n=1 Tax=Mycobacterium sp. ACS4331 TaxID=1834121 RepID=UPI00080164D2|nr:CPBP family intramembrane glutamic endopeptidase [Mycobacterium sp. ACS4331]OBF16220.1 abortive phage infection protein [Mycobacterium sp. ACS4331]